MGADELNPAQREVMDLLGARRDERPSFDDELRHHLRAELEHGLAPIVALLPEADNVFVSKRTLSEIHGCEARAVAPSDFAWNVPAARGVVAHKAVELSVHWRRELTPLVLVDEALARLEEGTDDLARWLQGCREVERAELRSEAGDRVTKFLECWPRLDPRWRPATEARVRQDVAGDRVRLSGKVDLQLGAPDGLVAGKVLVDFKTGGASPVHLEDLRFYALVETLRVGVPPRRLATYYLDQGRFLIEDVTVGLLRSTVARVVDGVGRLVELTTKVREPRRAPGPRCRWCHLLDDCTDGRAYVAARDEDELAGW